jgi:hypothetical protein
VSEFIRIESDSPDGKRWGIFEKHPDGRIEKLTDDKLKAIKDAYGPYWNLTNEFVDNEGWAYTSPLFNHVVRESGLQIKVEISERGDVWRPESLRGIENNNGWIKITTQADLPKVGGEYWVMWRGQSFPDTHDFRLGDDEEFWLKHITHYQRIVPPPPPIY